jgi:heme/copper-type cytochrome/quinol oxidase subunit 2
MSEEQLRIVQATCAVISTGVTVMLFWVLIKFVRSVKIHIRRQGEGDEWKHNGEDDDD